MLEGFVCPPSGRKDHALISLSKNGLAVFRKDFAAKHLNDTERCCLLHNKDTKEFALMLFGDDDVAEATAYKPYKIQRPKDSKTVCCSFGNAAGELVQSLADGKNYIELAVAEKHQHNGCEVLMLVEV